MYILLPELATVFPLPGKYIGVVATNESGIRHIHGIAISLGEDNTKKALSQTEWVRYTVGKKRRPF